MSARQDISKLLDQWLELTHAEGVSIQSASWEKMRAIQAEKARLQKSLDKARHNLLAGNQSDVSFRAQISRLLSMEERNRALLQAQMKRAQQEQQSLYSAYRNLQKIQRSYNRKRQVIAWQCLS